MIAWNSPSKVTAPALPCLSVGVCPLCVCGCVSEGAAGGLREPPSEELRGHGSRGERGKEKGLRGKPEQKQRVVILFHFIVLIRPSTPVFFPPANPLGATLAKRDAFFIQPPRPGSVKLHFFSEALLRGKKKERKKIRSHGSPNAFSCGVIFCCHILRF